MALLSCEQYKEINQIINHLENQIDMALSQKDYALASKIISSEEVVSYSSHSSTLYTLRILNVIYLEELHQEINNHIFLDRNISQLIQTYIQLCFYLRRLEFDFPIELQKELISFIANEKLSFVCIIGTIKQSIYIYSKDLVLNQFRFLMQTI